MDLPIALRHLLDGKCIRNENWTDRNYSHIFALPGFEKHTKANATLAKAASIDPDSDITVLPYLMMCTKLGNFVPYTFTNSDIFSDSWRVVNRRKT